MAKKYMITKKNANESNTFDNMINGLDNAGLFIKGIKNVGEKMDDDELSLFITLSMVAPDFMATDKMIESAIPVIRKLIYVLGEAGKELMSPAVIKELREELIDEKTE